MQTINKNRRTVLGSLGALALAEYAGHISAQSKASPQPNIVFILADDLGYGDLSIYGQTDFQTPHLDKLAKQGLLFTQAYANSAVCSATRVGLITGRYQYRLRVGLEEPIALVNDGIGLSPDHPTLPSLLKKAGYATALIGKWHLGGLPNFSPLKSGYDIFFGNYNGAIDYFNHKSGSSGPVDLYEGEVPVHKTGYYTDLLGDRAADYIKQQDHKKPFFLSLHFTAPHWPWEGPDDEALSREITSLRHDDGGNLVTYAKMVVAMDKAIGRVLKALETKGLADNTIVIFTSDNGGERFSKNWPFTGQKLELLEGGIRIPAIMRWPTHINANSVSSQVTISMGWLPTLLAAAGTAPAPDYPSDGENILPWLMGKQAPVARTLYWRYKMNGQQAVRAGNWKYLKINDNEFLFDVVVDQRERANLAAKNPAVLAQLKAQWAKWNDGMLPMLPETFSGGVQSKMQADRYAPGVMK